MHHHLLYVPWLASFSDHEHEVTLHQRRHLHLYACRHSKDDVQNGPHPVRPTVANYLAFSVRIVPLLSLEC
jgi:hypothetical protein